MKTYADGLLVLGIVAVGGEDTELAFLAVKCLADLVESLNKSYNQAKLGQYCVQCARKSI